MIPVLALDLATSTGWARRDANGYVVSGVQRFDLSRGESAGMRFIRLRAWLTILTEGMWQSGGVVAYEQAHHRGGAATACCVGMVTVVLEHAAARGLETLPVHSARLKKHATGRGNADKAAMIAAAEARWPQFTGPLNSDQADALCVLAWAIEEVGE